MDAPSAQYTVLARRFRPQTFDDVVGQQHVARALRNAVTGGRVAHAYLFTGARGVGKTSMARILAKALNCPHAVDAVPCNACEICDGISGGQDVDVQEIDGASNRGIDDIRALRANVNVRSMRTRHKVYIVDEVHMLTKEAFNALLKTLEEPPPGVKFVFCTTEPSKVPDTILSRCQRFDFATIETQNIVRRLHEIAEAEGYDVDPAALELVARRAAGSMRDSQSLFDQLLAFGEKRIGVEDVHRLLGTAPDERLTDLFGALVERRTGDALRAFDATLSAGVQLGELVDQLVTYARDLLILGVGADGVGLLSVAETMRPVLAEQARVWGGRTILAALQILAEAKSRMKFTTVPRPLVELALVRLGLLEDLDRLDELVAALQSGSVLPSGPVARIGSVSRTTSPSASSSVPPVVPAAPASSAAPHPSVPAGGANSGPPQSESPPRNLAPSPVAETAPKSGPAPSNGAVCDPQRSPREQDSTESNAPTPARRDPPAAPPPTGVSEQRVEGPAESAPDVEKHSPDSGCSASDGAAACCALESGREQEFWAQVLAGLKEIDRSQATQATRTAISAPNHLDVFFPASYDFARRYCEKADVAQRILEVASGLAGRKVSIAYRASEAEVPRPAPSTPEPAAANAAPLPIPKDEDLDPYVLKARSLFGASIVRVDRVEPSSTSGE